MKIVSSRQMRELDRAAIERHGIPSLVLMERAGEGLAAAATRCAERHPGPILVLAGRGNNGGDGLVAARLLIERGIEVLTVLLAPPEELTQDARANLDRLAAMGGRIEIAARAAALESLGPEMRRSTVAIDAILGIGLDREVTGLAARAIAMLNELGICVIAADIPSGLSADTGLVQGMAVRATRTVTFGLPKQGLFLGQGPDFAGRVEVVDIGIPQEAIAAIASPLELIDAATVAAALPQRTRSAHKGQAGHVVIVAGAGGHLGAGYLAALAALRTGCGLVTYLVPEAAFERFDARYPEIMCDPIPDSGTGHFTPAGLDRCKEICRDKDAVAIGPAIGTDSATRAFVNALLQETSVPAVVDADALNVLGVKAIASRTAATILTPHPGEMSRLAGIPTSEVQADRVGVAQRLAAASHAVVVLKGAATVIATPDGRTAINPTGNPGMASAGMGDALTGIIASLVAQGLLPADAAMAGVYLHGLAGDLAAEELGEASLIATEIIARLGRAMEACSPR